MKDIEVCLGISEHGQGITSSAQERSWIAIPATGLCPKYVDCAQLGRMELITPVENAFERVIKPLYLAT
jgi:hypothetical protein